MTHGYHSDESECLFKLCIIVMITHELVIKVALAHVHQYGKILIGWGVILIV